MSDQNTEKIVNQTYLKHKNNKLDPDLLSLITPEEIIQTIKTTKATKAPGHDKIQNIILNNLPRKSVIQLMYIFNACLLLSYFPSSWKKAIVLPFNKPGKDKQSPQNYRPIILLCTLGKILEIIMNNRLRDFVGKNNILINEQFGFRRHHSTVQQLS